VDDEDVLDELEDRISSVKRVGNILYPEGEQFKPSLFRTIKEVIDSITQLEECVKEQVTTKPITEPEVEPEVEPWRTPHTPKKKPTTPIKPTPGIHPKPKAMNKDVELFKKARREVREVEKFIHPEKQKWIDTGDPELNAIFPELSSGEKTYLQEITSDTYQDLVARLEKYTGLKAKDLYIPRVLSIFLQSFTKVISIEKRNKKKLEQLALSSVLSLDEFQIVKESYDQHELEFDIKLGPPELSVTNIEKNINSKSEEGLSFAEELNLNLSDNLSNDSSEKIRRRFSNLLIQGGAILKLYLFNLVSSALDEIDNNLVNMYGIISTFAQLGYWISPEGIEELAVGTPSEAGSEEVVPKGDIYVIKVRATCFPFLVHELVKGIYEWISLNPDLEKAMEFDTLPEETKDILAGPGVFKAIQKMVPSNKQYLLPLLQKKLVGLEPNKIKAILAGSVSGHMVFDDLVKQSEKEWKEYRSQARESFLRETKVIESLKQDKIDFVDSRKVTQEVFDKFVNSDPSYDKHKYLRWMLKQQVLFSKRTSHIVDVTVLFDSLVRRGVLKGEESDIYSYDLESADDLVSRKESEKTKSQLKREEKSGATKLRETDDYLVVRLESYPAACYYGANTKWCISGKTASYWNSYYGKQGNEIYVVIDKRDNKKYAVVVSPDKKKTVYDERDREISYSEFKRKVKL